MPTTSSPWASPSSPAGRRLIQTEPVTLDAVPVLDDATFAALAAAARPALPAPVAAAGRPCRPRPTRPRWARRSLALVAMVAVLLGVAAVALRTGPEAPVARPSASAPHRDLGQIAGEAVTAAPPAEAGGEVVVALIEPTDTLRATPDATPGPSVGARVGAIAVAG